MTQARTPKDSSDILSSQRPIRQIGKHLQIHKSQKKLTTVRKADTDQTIHKAKSILSIYLSQKQSSVSSLMQNCPLKVIKSHFDQSSQQRYKRQHQNSEKKKDAYLFFQQQKQKIMKKERQLKYLLPKICAKRQTIQIKEECNQIQNLTTGSGKPSQKQLKANLVDRKQKIFSSVITANNSSISPQIEHKIQNFKRRCDEQLSKIGLILPKKSQKKRHFFDLSSQQISQLYDESCPGNESQSDHKQEQETKFAHIDEGDRCKKQRKFHVINMSPQKSQIQQNNSSVPSFLMQRLSIKNSQSLKKIGFLTEVSMSKKIKAFSPQGKKMTQQSISMTLKNLR